MSTFALFRSFRIWVRTFLSGCKNFPSCMFAKKPGIGLLFGVTVSWFAVQGWAATATLGRFYVAQDQFAAKESSEPESETVEIDFNRDIRPILSDTCYKCHGPDEEHRAADLRLDSADGLSSVVISGDPAGSELVSRILTDDADMLMPPADSGRELTEDQIFKLKAWVQQGANWQQHWSFVAPEKVAVSISEWGQNEIDHFVYRRMQTKGLEPNQRAMKSDLLRRLTLDLIGIPPTKQQLDEYLADDSEEAYEKQVDRLLASPHFGEHRARYWMDVARYGDTHGLHLDNYREMWLYRDWVVQAFNRNLPYDQFTIQQLAGDLLESPTEDQIIASGFNRAHITTSEGGAIAAEVDMRNVVDRTSTTGTVFMGLTVGCCVCHDHKYDPISQKEFYQLYAFFNSIEGNPLDGNAKDHPPILRVMNEEQKQKKADYESKIQTVAQEIAEKLESIHYQEPVLTEQQQSESPQEFVWVDEDFPDGAQPSTWDWKTEAITQAHSGERSWHRKASGLTQHFFTGATEPLQINSPDDVLFTHVFLDKADPPKEIMLQWNNGNWEHRAYWGANSIDWGSDLSPSRFRIGELPEAGQWIRLEVRAGDVGLEAGTKINGWAFTQFDGSVQWDAAGLVTSGQPVAVYRSLKQWVTDISAVADSGLPEPIKTLVKKNPGQLAEEEKIQLEEYFVQFVYEEARPVFAELHKKKQQLESELKALTNSAPTTLVSKELPKPKPAFIMKRGEYDQPGDSVVRDTPRALPAFPENLPKNRLGLAKWLVSENHPLTARVTVNRFWQEFFGVGIVKTSEDFGAQGETPSHPELLDWLAVDFVEHNWDVKRLCKQMVMSETYRQDSLTKADEYKIDPENRLLARGARYRLDAETLRDQALFVAGLLTDEIGGPGVKPPQPDGLWFAVGYSGSNTVRFKPDSGHKKVHRRSLYTFWKRTSPPPQMSTFDAPSREECSVRRERTNTPLQALLLMNDPQYVEAARCFGHRILVEGGNSDRSRIAFAVKLALCRDLRSQEEAKLLDYLQYFREDFQAEPKAAQALIAIGEQPAESENPTELAAWTMVANLIYNLDEFVCKN